MLGSFDNKIIYNSYCNSMIEYEDGGSLDGSE